MKKIVVVDYGMGNLRSVEQALRTAAPEVEVRISGNPAELKQADRLILPGQGAMPDCMRALQELELHEVLLEQAAQKPVFGICIGEQMLFESSEEGHTPGLGLIPGKVIRFRLKDQLQADGSRYKVPQMGWNRVHQVAPHPLWQGITDQSFFYFVHSYYAVPDNPAHVIGTTEYGVSFACAVARNNLFATQFHPEKSGPTGLQLYRNFINWNP